MKFCPVCSKKLIKDQKKFCSNRCQAKFKFQSFIEGWKRGVNSGTTGIVVKTHSNYLERYLREKFHDKCSQCGWSERNMVTNRVPLEIDHIDGNSENDDEKNLRLVCPNCHSLSSNFRNLNKGRGRTWRRQKYIKNKQSSTLMESN